MNLKDLSKQELEKLLKSKQKEATQLHNAQMTIKIAMNALYGASANIYFQYYIAEMAEAITTSGQLSILYAEKSINTYLNKIMETDNVDYVIYIDTDSVYVNFEPLIQKVFGTTDISNEQAEKFLDKICKDKIEAVLTQGYDELAAKMGAFRNAMSMKREKITNKTLFIAKKRYILNTLNSEGTHYEEPKISVTGLESVRSSTPEICRDKMKKMFKLVMNEDEETVQAFIAEFKEEFKNYPADEIGKTSGTDDIEKYMDKQRLYKSGCPIHVRGAILFNDFIKRKGLEKKYQPIISGDKVKLVYLKLPNPVRENVIAFSGMLPKEFELEQYIDYETQFEKVFLKPMDTIVNAVGWSTEKISTLDDFFS